jgi:hypothetical protein
MVMERVNELFELLEVLQDGSGVADVQRVRAQLMSALHELLRYMAREDAESVVLAYLERRTRYTLSNGFKAYEVARFTGLSNVVVGRVLHGLERVGVVQRGRLRGEWHFRRESIRALTSVEAVQDVQDAVDPAAHGVQDSDDPVRLDRGNVAEPEECQVDEQDMVDVQDAVDPAAHGVQDVADLARRDDQDAVDPVAHVMQDDSDPVVVPIEAEDVNRRWQAFVERLKTASPAAWRCLAGSYLEVVKGAVCVYLRSEMALVYIRASEQRKESVKMAVRKVMDMPNARVVFRVQDGDDLATHGVQDAGDLAHRDEHDAGHPVVDSAQEGGGTTGHGVQDVADLARRDDQDAVDPVAHVMQDDSDPVVVPIEAEDVNRRWQAFVERLKTASPAAWRCLAGSYLEVVKGAVCVYLRSEMALVYIRASEQRKESVKMAVRKVMDMPNARVVFRVQDGDDLATHGVQDAGDLAHRDEHDAGHPVVDSAQEGGGTTGHGVQDVDDPAKCEHTLCKAVLALTLDQPIEVYRDLFARWAQRYTSVECAMCKRVRDWVSVVPDSVSAVESMQKRVCNLLKQRLEKPVEVEEYPPPRGEYSERQMAWLRCILGFIDTRGSASVMKLVSQLRVEKLCRVDEWQEAERFIRYVASVGECGLRLDGEIVSRMKVK